MVKKKERRIAGVDSPTYTGTGHLSHIQYGNYSHALPGGKTTSSTPPDLSEKQSKKKKKRYRET